MNRETDSKHLRLTFLISPLLTYIILLPMIVIVAFFSPFFFQHY